MSTGPAGKSKPHVRAQVLGAALAAFEELGPDRVRVQDIAERAGMSSGHVMYYFGDRDSILVGTLLLSEENLAERRERAVGRAGSAAEVVDRVTRLYLPASSTDVRWALWAQVIARPPADPGSREQLRDAVDAWADCLAEAIAAGSAEGTLADVDSSATAYRYCRLMDGLAIEVLLGASGHGRSWAVREALAAFDALAGP